MAVLHRPDWIQAWEEAREDNGAVNAATLRNVVGAVRSGITLDEAEALTGMDRKQLFKLIATVGARCTQIGKNHTRAHAVVAGLPGMPAVVSETREGPVVTAAGGWVRSRREGDIRKAYAALLLAEDRIADVAVDRVADAAGATVPVGYGHFSDLHGAARGVLPPLHEVVAAPTAAEAYLQAWYLIDGTVAAGHAAVRQLIGRPTPQQVQAAAKAAFWLIPQPQSLHRWASTCLSAGSPTERMMAEQRMMEQLRALRMLTQRQQQRVAPRRLEQLSVSQMRAIAGLHGHHPTDGTVARTETLLEEFATKARAVWSEARALQPA